MTLEQLAAYFQNIPEQIGENVPDIVAETATEYFKDTFRTKEFDRNPWVPAKKPKKTGSLLVDSSAMLNSIRPAVVNRREVVVSAGDSKVTYARKHNEGLEGMPRRQFLGPAVELLDDIYNRIQGYLKSIL